MRFEFEIRHLWVSLWIARRDHLSRADVHLAAFVGWGRHQYGIERRTTDADRRRGSRIQRLDLRDPARIRHEFEMDRIWHRR